MSEVRHGTSIEWTHAEGFKGETWNPVTGCTKVSPGCAHCYAETFAERWRGIPGRPFEQGFDLKLWPERLELPLRWRKPRMVFVNSMSDLFHEDIPDEYIARVFRVMARASQHTFQVLTKRPDRMQRLLADRSWARLALGNPAPLPNVWLGVSIENRRYVDRADLLRDTPAAMRFISAEPLLGPLVYDTGIGMYNDCACGAGCEHPKREGDPYEPCWSDGFDGPDLDLHGIDWLIAGGESGPGHRRLDPDWVRDLRDLCMGSETAFFFKQWGGHRPKSNGRDLDGRTWDEMPEAVEREVPDAA